MTDDSHFHSVKLHHWQQQYIMFSHIHHHHHHHHHQLAWPYDKHYRLQTEQYLHGAVCLRVKKEIRTFFLDSLARNNTKKRQLTLLVFLFASNVFEANHANTLWAKITAFARSSEPIWIKFGTLWAKCWGLAAADFGCDPRSIRQFERKPIFFCHANHEWFRRFPSNKFYDTWTQQRQSVSPCKTFVITSQWLQIAEIYFQMVPLRDV